jgi:exodeoxyribonuclease-3
MIEKPMPLVASWNVNGIRSVTSKTYLQWVQAVSPDVICLQETKATQSQIPEEVFAEYPYYQLSAADKKGYSGVLTLSKTKPLKIETLGIQEFDSEGRTLIFEFEDSFIINCYFPNGQRDHGRVPYKLRYCQAIETLLLELEKTQKKIFICGDFNTAHHPIDLANPKTNKNTTGFLLEERAWLDQLIHIGFQDCFRALHGDKLNEYTWWTYRNNCRERNIGWRIDYFFANSPGVKSVKSIQHQQDILGSDHCPLLLEFL